MPIPTFPLAGDILTQARKEANLGTNIISSSLQDDSLYQVLQDIDEFGVAYPVSIGVLGWPFLDREVIIQSVANDTLNGAVAKGDSSLTLTSGASFGIAAGDTVGAAYIYNSNQMYDFFTYETASGTPSISGVSGISEAHSSAEEVHKCYLLPSDFGYPRGLYRQSVFYQYQRIDEGIRQIPPHPFYTIKYLTGTNYSGNFLVFPYKIGVLDWKFAYQKRAIDLDSAADQANTKMSLPKGNGRRYYIYSLASFMSEQEGDDNRAATFQKKAMEFLDKLIDEYQLLDMSSQSTQVLLTDW